MPSLSPRTLGVAPGRAGRRVWVPSGALAFALLAWLLWIAPAAASTVLYVEARPDMEGARRYTGLVQGVPESAHVVFRLQEAGEIRVDSVDVLLGASADELELVIEPRKGWDAAWEPPPPDGSVLASVQFDIVRRGEAPSIATDFTTLSFRLPKEDLDRASVDADEVRVARWTGTGWSDLPTALVWEETGSYRFSASGPGDGVFAIHAAGNGYPGDAPMMSLGWLIGGVVALNGVVGVMLYRLRDRSVSDLQREHSHRKRPWS